MEAALKQRLIGASVIIALAIIFVPMLFNSEPQQKAKSISIEIPQKPDTDLETKTFSLDEPVVNLPPAEVELQEDATSKPAIRPIESTPDDTETTTVEIVEVKPQETPPVTEDTTAQKPTETVVEDVTESKPPVVENTVVVEEQPKPQETTPTNTKPAVTTPPNESAGLAYRIKLGSFSQKENAEKLKATLLQNNIRSAVSLEPGKKLYRVWSEQSYSSRQAAENYVAQVNKLKLNIGEPKVIEIDANAMATIRDSSTLGWVIQLGSFSKKENALDLRNRLRLQKYESFVDLTSNAAQQRRYRVRIGPFLEKGDAESTNKVIKSRLQLDGLIKAHDLSPVVD
ncbi:SPOR domain-containing protein [Marinicella sp. W31]|uniref:SPOR domain-containing protein n=1 Tax=Marinicella sp. W31 TaxID=3023713 RepID=UPI0037580C80